MRISKRHVLNNVALVLAVALFGCSPETPEMCVKRFQKLLASSDLVHVSDHSDPQLRPLFTYDVTKMEDSLLYAPEGLSEASFADRFDSLEAKRYDEAISRIDQILTLNPIVAKPTKAAVRR